MLKAAGGTSSATELARAGDWAIAASFLLFLFTRAFPNGTVRLTADPLQMASSLGA